MALNCFVQVQKFKMESNNLVVAPLASIDIKDAFLHIPIYEGHQQLLFSEGFKL